MKKELISEVVVYIGILLLGICMSMWADQITNIASILLGVLAVAYGGIAIVNYFKGTVSNKLQFIYGIVILVVGIVLMVRVNFLKELISFIVGIYILLSSALKLHNAFVLGKDNKKFKTSLILSIIGIFVGILCIVGKFLLPDIIITFIGIMLIIYSVVSITNLIIVNTK